MVWHNNNNDVRAGDDSPTSRHDCVRHCRNSAGYPHDHHLPWRISLLYSRNIPGGATGAFPSNRPVPAKHDAIDIYVMSVPSI